MVRAGAGILHSDAAAASDRTQLHSQLEIARPILDRSKRNHIRRHRANPSLRAGWTASVINAATIWRCHGISTVLRYVERSTGIQWIAFVFNEWEMLIGTTLFAIEAVGVVIALEGNMKTPKSFGSPFGVLNVGMLFITVLYAAFGFLGYWKYGSGSDESITLNLPRGEM